MSWVQTLGSKNELYNEPTIKKNDFTYFFESFVKGREEILALTLTSKSSNFILSSMIFVFVNVHLHLSNNYNHAEYTAYSCETNNRITQGPCSFKIRTLNDALGHDSSGSVFNLRGNEFFLRSRSTKRDVQPASPSLRFEGGSRSTTLSFRIHR